MTRDEACAKVRALADKMKEEFADGIAITVDDEEVDFDPGIVVEFPANDYRGFLVLEEGEWVLVETIRGKENPPREGNLERHLERIHSLTQG